MKVADQLKATDRLARGEHVLFSSCPDGMDSLVLADLAGALAAKTRDRQAAILHIARDGARSAAV